MRFKPLYIILILLTQFLTAQTPVISKLSEKEGLPDEEIYDILEDKNGYIWMAANKGLYRYNGKTFEHFTHPIKRGLSVFGLFEDTNGNIWCNNISGQFFYIKNNQLYFFTDLNSEINGQLPEFKILNNQLIALTEKGILTVDLKTRTKKLIQDSSTQSSLFYSPFIKNNQFYFFHGNDLKKLAGNKVQHITTFGNKPSKNSATCFTKELQLIHIQQETSTFYLWKNNTFSQINTPEILKDKVIIRILYKEGKYWFTTNKGLFVFKWQNNQFYFLYHYLENDVVSKIIFDRNSNYWISSTQSGLHIIPSTSILKINLEEGTIASSLAKISNNLIAFGTNSGKIGLYSTITQKTKYYSLPETKKINHLVYHQHANKLLISNESMGYLFDLNTGELLQIPDLTSAKDLAIKNSSTILISYYNKAQWLEIPYLDKATTWNQKLPEKLVQSKTKIPVLSKIIRNKRAYACSTTNFNTYIAYVDNFISNDTQIILNQNQPIFTVDIENANSDIWVSTFENGLLKINRNKVVANLNTKNGLLSNYSGALKATKNGLWIVTDKGLQFYTKDGNFKNLFRGNGLETYDFKKLEAVGNYLFLASNKGFYAIETNTIFKNFNQPNLFLSKIVSNDKLQPLHQKFYLNPEDNSVQFFFNSTGYQHDYQVQYQYRLKNQSDKWITLDKGAQSLLLSNLADGNYNLELRIKYNASEFTKAKEINFEITPPFWKRAWFIILFICLLVGVMYFYFQYRIKKTEKTKQLELEQAYAKQELIASQLENLRSQMNPHFIFNALNSIQEFIISNEKEVASEYLVKFSRLIRVYLDHSRQSEVSLQEEIKALEIYLELEKVRFEEKLNYHISVDAEINQLQTMVPSLFLQPYVENALKHGLLHKKDNRKLVLNFKKLTNELLIEIIDNGIGLTEAKRIKEARNFGHQSFAMSANQKRVQLLNKTRENKISVSVEEQFENEISAGTKVTIIIPNL